MSRVSAVAAFPIAVEFSSATGVSNVPGGPSYCWPPGFVGFPAVVASLMLLASLLFADVPVDVGVTAVAGDPDIVVALLLL